MADIGVLNVKNLATSTLNVRINVTNQLKVRIFLATLFIRLAALALGAGVKIDRERGE